MSIYIFFKFASHCYKPIRQELSQKKLQALTPGYTDENVIVRLTEGEFTFRAKILEGI